MSKLTTTDRGIAGADGNDSSVHNLLPDDEWLPVSGWPLKELGTLAEITDTPSLLVFANRARPRWRQAVYLALAVGAFNTADVFLRRADLDTSGTRDEQLRRIARSLPVWTPGKILTACFDGPPRGLMSTLKKLDHEPLRRVSYGLLAGWHQDQQRDHARCNLLQRMVTLKQGHLDAVETLDPVLLTPALLRFTSSKMEADRLNDTLHVIRKLCSTADDETLQKGARELHGTAMIGNWAEGWLRRADRLSPPPFDGDDECHPVVSGPGAEDITRRFRNCLSNRYLAPILSGKIAVVEYVPGPALALMSRLSDGHWLLVSIHAPGNRPVSDELSERVVKKVRSFGAHIHVLEKPDPKVVEIVQHVLGGFEPFDLEQALDG